MPRARVRRPPGMSNEEFYGVWQRKRVVSREALRSGLIPELHEVTGQNGVIGIMEAGNADTPDEAIHALPIWTEGYPKMVDLEWTPLRLYENRGRQLDEPVSETAAR
jgi:hypothetical protein